MKSEFKRLHKNALMQWVYDDANSIVEPYKIVNNSKILLKSYVASDSTITNNGIDNQLVLIDEYSNKFGKLDTSKYNFVSIGDYFPQGPIIHDRVQMYFPSNFTFEEYQGIYLRLFTYDYRHIKFFDISNFYFDKTDTTKSELLYEVSPILYQNTVWNQIIELNVPSVYHLAKQRENGYASSGSINSNLTSGEGLSQTAPIFIDFRFITKIQKVGTTTTYLTTQKVNLQVPQTPQLELLGLFIEESKNGDYFEIFGIYDGLLSSFISFLEDSRNINKFYVVEFDVTFFEENIPGKTQNYIIRDDFAEIIEYRPIVKYSTENGVIEVEMRLLNLVDGSTVIRKASYGLKPDQLSKYLINLKKINVRDVFKPKIYSKNRYIKYKPQEESRVLQQIDVDVPSPEFIPIIDSDKFISAYSPQALNVVLPNQVDNFHPLGLLKIRIQPFDNVITFTLAHKISGTNFPTLEFMDLTNCEEIKLVFRNDTNTVEFSQYLTVDVVAKFGMCQFNVTEDKFNEINNIFLSGFVVFYITTTNRNFRNVLYSGLFTTNIPDEIAPPEEQDETVDNIEVIDSEDFPVPGKDPETAVVTRRVKYI